MRSLNQKQPRRIQYTIFIPERTSTDLPSSTEGRSSPSTSLGTGRCTLTISTNWPRMRSDGSGRGRKGTYWSRQRPSTDWMSLWTSLNRNWVNLLNEVRGRSGSSAGLVTGTTREFGLDLENRLVHMAGFSK